MEVPIEEKSNNTSAADEIDLNSDDGGDQLIDSTSKLELRTEPDDIFEDIPEMKESRNDSSTAPLVFEPASKVQVYTLSINYYYVLHTPTLLLDC